MMASNLSQRSIKMMKLVNTFYTVGPDGILVPSSAEITDINYFESVSIFL